MQSPPATSLQVVRSTRAGYIFLALTLAFAGVPLYGWFAGMPINSVWLLVILWCIASAWLTHYWRNMPQGRLRWDGESWHWSSSTEPLRSIAIQYDFQTSLWLLIEPGRGRKFGIWVDADPQHVAQWHAMRRALVSAGPKGSDSEDSLHSSMQALR